MAVRGRQTLWAITSSRQSHSMTARAQNVPNGSERKRSTLSLNNEWGPKYPQNHSIHALTVYNIILAITIFWAWHCEARNSQDLQFSCPLTRSRRLLTRADAWWSWRSPTWAGGRRRAVLVLLGGHHAWRRHDLARTGSGEADSTWA